MNDIPSWRIIVIDDNPDDRALVCRELDALFPTAVVIEPTDLAAFEAALAEAEPDLVVTDLDIRWTNGRWTLAAVKQAYPNCPVVMFTGTGDEMTAVELMKSGLDDYVVKSVRQLSRLQVSLKLAVEMAKTRAAVSTREAQLIAMVAHRDTIVRELHHRVKNNLQTVVSLLQLGGKKADSATREQLGQISQRMQALGSVQARIYETETLDSVNFSAALRDIVEGLENVYSDGQITLNCDLDHRLDLDVGRAMPLGLLCYEVILNAYKHAWPQRGSGSLVITLHFENRGCQIIVWDDGVGYDGTKVTKGLGSRLIQSLASEARVRVSTMSNERGGTEVSLELL
ncbi:histidine kinase [Sphingomonas antarctica]|uniref:histidine kinase dimerization/phosphoacceptor domain -containing protein n=1 Tax=Sphingomonas antarctica TaxID=2040274 RepID=UPI0039E8AFD4